jgi:ankyrin repeat protein
MYLGPFPSRCERPRCQQCDSVTSGIRPRRLTYSHGDDFYVLLLPLQYSSDIHSRDDKGRVPLMIASAVGKYDVERLLSKYQAKYEAEEDHGIIGMRCIRHFVILDVVHT